MWILLLLKTKIVYYMFLKIIYVNITNTCILLHVYIIILDLNINRHEKWLLLTYFVCMYELDILMISFVYRPMYI